MYVTVCVRLCKEEKAEVGWHDTTMACQVSAFIVVAPKVDHKDVIGPADSSSIQ